MSAQKSGRKTFNKIISKLVYLASLLPNPPIYITNKINNLIFDFMWNGKGDKIKRNVMINLHDKRGLNIPHFQTVCIAQKITWVKRYIHADLENSQWANLVNHVYKSVGGQFIFRCNMRREDIQALHIKSEFWNDVCQAGVYIILITRLRKILLTPK